MTVHDAQVAGAGRAGGETYGRCFTVSTCARTTRAAVRQNTSAIEPMATAGGSDKADHHHHERQERNAHRRNR